MQEIDWKYWAALAGAAIYVGARDAERAPVKLRLLKTASSALLAVGTSEKIAPVVYDSKEAAIIIIMAFSWFFLDIGTSILSDRQLFIEMLRERMGLPPRKGKDQ